ncbi:MAG: uroporphyrinogen-III synthase [Cyanobacteriota/Melainabacteria group bacterium]
MHLTGQRILITRATSQADSFKLALEAAGARPILIPVIEIKEPSSWEPFDKALAQLSEYDWVIFASTNAVRSFIERMDKTKVPKRICPI